MGLIWKPDYLGNGFSCAELDLGTDDEGQCVATLVCFSPPVASPATPPAAPPGFWERLRAGVMAPVPWLEQVATRLRPKRQAPDPEPVAVTAVLYVHGWSDYFMHRGLAEFYAERGVEFYALDLRKYGRSLRSWQTPGYIADLAEYDEDLDAALQALSSHIRSRRGAEARIAVHLMAHSTGALTCSLWVNRHPGRVASLILNGPWLDVQGSAILRGAARLDPVTRFRPKSRLKLPDIGFYWRSISSAGDGDWDLHPQWRPQFGFPIRAGWLAAILAGHAQVRRGLAIDVPVLVLASARSSVSPVWNDSMLSSDSVLDVTLMTQRALQLGPAVTVCRYEGALHDVLLSKEPVRRRVYQTLEGWLRCQQHQDQAYPLAGTE